MISIAVLAAVFAAAALIAMAVIAITNVLSFPRLSVDRIPGKAPLVSILIPARDEAAVIGQTVRALSDQTYPNYEVVVLDDQSTDDTAGEVMRAAGSSDRVRMIKGAPLPHGWAGKNWACEQLAQQARGDILIFTDADVRWQPEALAAVMTGMRDTDADLFTVWPTQSSETRSERLVVPLMAFVITAYLPLFMVHHSPFPAFAAANGQCMAWKRGVYQAVGGHKAVASSVLDDVNLARLVKRHGFRLRMADGAGLIRCRMYRSWPEVRDGFAKNVLAGYGSAPALVAATVFHFVVFLLPCLWLLTPGYHLWGAALLLLGIGIRALSAAFTRQRVSDALLLPLSVVLMTRIAIRSLRWHFSGGPRWKGRIISPASTGGPANA